MATRKMLVGESGGYTMIEVLLSVTIFVVVMISGTNLFLSSIVGTGKEKVVREIKQSGEFAITRIESSLRGARGLVMNSGGKVCEREMASVKYEGLDGVAHEIGVAENRLVLDGSYLTSDGMKLEDQGTGGLAVDCERDLGSGVTYVKVSFTLIAGGEVGDKPEETFTETFETSVTLRNR